MCAGLLGGRGVRFLPLAAAVVLVVLGIAAPAAATAAPLPGSLEEQCIAAGTVAPEELRGYVFNHHPEKKREPRATDNYLTVLETVAEFHGLIAQLPEACSGHFSRSVLVKAEFRAGGDPDRWRSVRGRWERLEVSQRYLDYSADPPTPSPYGEFRGLQNANTFGLGCTIDARVKLKLEIVNEGNGAIIARRVVELPLPVDSWFRARCQGEFSIQDSAAAQRCGQRVIGGAAIIWGVKAQGVGCARASAVAQKALQEPSFNQGELLEQRVDGWRCFYGHRGAASCHRGDKHVYIIARGGGIAEKCATAPRGVKHLQATGTSCEVAAALALAVQGDPPTSLLVSHEANGLVWSCPAFRYLGEGDLMVNAYDCFSGGALISFDVVASKSERLVPVLPTAVPADVLFPPAGAIGFPQTPMLLFDYQRWAHGKVLLRLKADEALVGHRARIKIEKGTMECTWTADAFEDTPLCDPPRWLGRPVVRQITLEPEQQVSVGRRLHRGNWEYRVTVTTAPFVHEGIAYTKAKAATSASVVNEADNCSANPWCSKD